MSSENPFDTHPTSPFIPPPLPPRPQPATHRKPVPTAFDEGFPKVSATRSSVPPPIPPRPAASNPPQTASAGDSLPVFSSPPLLPPPKASVNNEKIETRAQKDKRWWYPATTKGRRWFWALLVLLVIAIAVVAAVCATVIPKETSTTSTSTAVYDGGHPLSVADGGVDIGQPGDIAVLGNKSSDHFVMTTNRSIVVTRLDPIVNPGAIGSHVHRVHGSSYFTQNLTSVTEMQELANCTTTVVQDDKSAYWVAAVYYKYTNGSLSLVPVDRTSLYYFQKAPTGVTIYPFPDNYNIVAGNPYRRAVNYSDPDHTALWYQCYRGDGNDVRSYGFPTTACSGGMVQGIQFPSCWDGVYADDGDYTDHVAYPTDSTNGYYCPDDFPKKFITLQFETVFAVYDFPFNGEDEITWVLANGDTSGYGIHADFMNGWKTSTLESVLNDCRYMNVTGADDSADYPSNCPPLNATIEAEWTGTCHLQTQIVNEDVGETVPITELPGCNALWTGNVSKPACPTGHVEGGDLDLVTPSVWLYDEPYIG